MPNFVKIGNTAAEIWLFLDFSRWLPPPSWIFEISIFNGQNVQEGRTAPRATFCQNRSNRVWDITIFRFFQDGGRPPCWICNACVGTTHEGHLVVFTTVQNLNRCSSFDNMHVFRFREFGLKTPIHTPKLGFLLGFWPLNGKQCKKIPKSTSLRESASL